MKQPDKARMKRMISDMKKYWNTYDAQEGCLLYTDKTFIDDALYGLGVAIDPKKYFAAQGYDKFKAALLERLLPDAIEESKYEQTRTLLPCPFCGSKNLIIDPYYDESSVVCQDCKTDGPAGNYVECQRLWNKRPREKMIEAAGAAKAVIALEQNKLRSYIDCVAEAGCKARTEVFKT
tara:strand:- start:728 stop:1261 length:534 start_codon:yes stop_codon:yes gene_type:complete